MIKKLVVLLFAIITLSCTEKEEAKNSLPVLILSDIQVAEDVGEAKVELLLEGSLDEDITVSYELINGSAVSGIHFKSIDTQVVIPAGVKSKQIPVRILNDNIKNFDRSFFIRLTGQYVTAAKKSVAEVTIREDDSAILLQFEKAAQIVLRNADTTASIGIALSYPSTETIAIPYRISGTALFQTDHLFTSGVAVIPANTTRVTINGGIVNNNSSGPNKTIIVEIDPVPGVAMGVRSHTIVISDGTSGLVASVANAPTGTSISHNLDVTVSGEGVTSYKYKVSTINNCDNEVGYSAPRTVDLKITDSLLNLIDGPLYLCVLGGNELGTFQNAASASVSAWTKNTSLPGNPTFKAILSKNKNLGIRRVLSNQSTVKIDVGNLKAGHDVSLFNSVTCEDGKKIGSIKASSVSANIEGVFATDGDHVLYAKSTDEFGRSSNCTEMLSLYRLDTIAPTIIDTLALEPFGYYGLNSVLNLKIKFSEKIETSRTDGSDIKPYLTLNTNPAIASAIYASSGDDSLIFEYIPKVTQNSLRLDFYSQTSLVPGSYSITDEAGNNAILILPSPGSDKSISGKTAILIDTEKPNSVAAISDGSWGPDTSSPTISWVKASDLGESGIIHYEVAVGSALGLNDIIDWTPTTNTQIAFTQSFVKGRNYFASIRVRDNANNLSDVLMANGWGVDPDAPSAFDVSLNSNISYSNTESPRIQWTAASDEISGVHHYEIALGSTVGGTDVVNWQSVSSTTLFYSFRYAGEYGKDYFPSVKAVDAAGNETLVTSTGWKNIQPITTPSPAPTFTAQTLLKPDSLTFSNEVTIQGIQGEVLVSIQSSEPDREALMSVNSGVYVSAATVRSGDKLKIRASSSVHYSTKVTFDITIGTGTYKWEISTWGCPTNYSLVKSKNSLQKDFCVAKYEPNGTTAKPIKGAPPTPAQSLPDAELFCSRNGSSYGLISNEEYQRVARDIESVGWNWSGGEPGVGILSGGNTYEGNTNSKMLPSDDDENPCSGIYNQTNCSLEEWSKYRRVHKLDSGDYIWDLSGNLDEWVSGAFDYANYQSYNPSALKCDSAETYGFEGQTHNVCRIQISEIDAVQAPKYKEDFGPTNDYSGLFSTATRSWGGIGIMTVPQASGSTWITRGGAWDTEVFSWSEPVGPLWRGGIFSVRWRVPVVIQGELGAIARCVYRMP